MPLKIINLLFSGSLFYFPLITVAQPELPVFSVDAYDTPLSETIDAKGLNTIVIYGDKLDLSHTTLSVLREKNHRVPDVVIVASSVILGPETNVDLQGMQELMDFDSLRGGDLYLVADKIIVNGLTGGRIRPPITVRQQGGVNPSDPMHLRSRGGVTYVFTNMIAPDEEYENIRKETLSEIKENTPVPASFLSIISQGFSSGNSIHRIINDENNTVVWGGLGEAYVRWIAEEPLADRVKRELHLVPQRTNPYDGTNIPDIVAPLSAAARYIPVQLLVPWYDTVISRYSTMVQAAIGNRDYSMAYQLITDIRRIIKPAPTAVLISPVFKQALTELQTSENRLTEENIVEDVSFPIDGGPPVTVSVIRDIAATHVAVVPNQILLSTLLDNGVYRAGVMRQNDNDIKISLVGHLTVDPSLMARVREKYAHTVSEVRVADDLDFGTINLGLGETVKNYTATIQRDNTVVIELLLDSSRFTQNMVRLAQRYGIDASVTWKHPGLNSDEHTSLINFGLGRTEMAIVALQGKITNRSPQAINIDYVMDGQNIIIQGFPIRLMPGDSATPPCVTRFCYAPGSAIRRDIAGTDYESWFMNMADSSSIRPYVFENQLGYDAGRGGTFSRLVLDVTYKASSNASLQKTELFILGQRGSDNARKSFNFLSPERGNGKMEVKGTAYWENGSQDLIPRTVESNPVIIDETWLP